jgi:acyl carrier protein
MTLQERLEQTIEGLLNQQVVLTDDTPIAGLPGWDSVTHINLIFSLEQEFGIEFSTREMSDVQTVGDLKHLLRQKTMAGRTAGSSRM